MTEKTHSLKLIQHRLKNTAMQTETKFETRKGGDEIAMIVNIMPRQKEGCQNMGIISRAWLAVQCKRTEKSDIDEQGQTSGIKM